MFSTDWHREDNRWTNSQRALPVKTAATSGPHPHVARSWMQARLSRAVKDALPARRGVDDDSVAIGIVQGGIALLSLERDDHSQATLMGPQAAALS